MASIEEESFVILGSSPLQSLCSNGDSLLNDAISNMQIAPQQPATGIESQSHEKTNGILRTDGVGDKSKELTLPKTSSKDENSLATSFILGEVHADVLKNSVYSQFPSLCSMQACAEDVVKLQNMMTEYVALKQTLDKVNNTMLQYYKITEQWRQEAANREQQYQNQLTECQAQLEGLRNENRNLKTDVETNLVQIRITEDVRQKEHDELIQNLSEKTSLINNMRIEIDKMAQQQLNSYEFIQTDDKEEKKEPLDFIRSDEHNKAIKELQRELSQLMAENLQFKDMQSTYLDEINCLKVNLTSAEELLNKTQADVNLLMAKDAQKQEEIVHLQTQVETYRRDFEMERADREKNAGEKEQYLQDLRALQRRNQELIEALAEAHKVKKSGATSEEAATSKSSVREEQRPIRVLEPTGAAAATSQSVLRCPICSKGFETISVLQSHVNDCLDKN